MLIVETTHPDPALLNTLAHQAIKAKLAACAQVEGPLRSTYYWESTLCVEEEFRLSLKTTESKHKSLLTWLEAEHPYDCPQLITLPVAHASEKYITWVVEQTQS